MAIGSWPYANGDGRDAMRIYPSSTRVRHVLPHTSIGPAPVNVFEMERKVTNNHSGIIYNFREGCWWCWTLLSSSILIHCILGRCGWLSARNSVRTLAGHKGMNVGVVGREDTWRAQMRKNLILIGRRLSVLPLVFGSRGCQQYFTAHASTHLWYFISSYLCTYTQQPLPHELLSGSIYRSISFSFHLWILLLCVIRTNHPCMLPWLLAKEGSQLWKRGDNILSCRLSLSYDLRGYFSLLLWYSSRQWGMLSICDRFFFLLRLKIKFDNFASHSSSNRRRRRKWLEGRRDSRRRRDVCIFRDSNLRGMPGSRRPSLQPSGSVFYSVSSVSLLPGARNQQQQKWWGASSTDTPRWEVAVKL